MSAKIRAIRYPSHRETGFVEEFRLCCWEARYFRFWRFEREVNALDFVLAEDEGTGSCLAVAHQLGANNVLTVAKR